MRALMRAQATESSSEPASSLNLESRVASAWRMSFLRPDRLLGLENGSRQLFDEQGYPIGPRDDLFADLIGQRLAGDDLLHHLGTRPVIEAVERHERDPRPPDPGRAKLGPEGDDDKHG